VINVIIVPAAPTQAAPRQKSARTPVDVEADHQRAGVIVGAARIALPSSVKRKNANSAAVTTIAAAAA